MALKQADKDKLKALGFDVDALIKAVTEAAEVDYAVPEGRLLTDAQLAERDNNTGASHKSEGVKEARGILVTELGKKIPGLTLKGERIGDLVNEISTFMSSTADAQVKTLQGQVQALLADKETLNTAVTTEKKRADALTFDSDIMGMFPAGRTQDLSDRERLTLLKSAYEFERDTNGGMIVKQNGQPVTDPNTRAPRPANDVVGEYFNTRKWVGDGSGGGKGAGAGQGGRGGGGSDPGAGGGAYKKMSAAKAGWIEANPGKNPNSPEFLKYVNEIASKDPQFDYHA